MRTKQFCFRAFLFVILTAFISSSVSYAAWQKPVRAKRGMVAAQHELASQIGVEIMKKGGNAIDAAIATGIALAVVYPEAGNIGGGGFMLIRLKDGRTTAIDYREMAPSAAHRDVFINKDGNVISGEGGSTIGYRASGVPGTLAGFEYAFKKYGSGKVKWSDLVLPAQRLAKNGYVLSYRLAELFKAYKGNLENYPESKRVFLRDGKYYEEGERLYQPDLAAVLARVAKFGAKDFYSGETAKLIADDMVKNNGLITLKDLGAYQPKERQPLTGKYRGATIISMSPPSSGGIAMLQVLQMLERFDIPTMEYNSSQKYHLVAEAMKRVFADRAVWLGDPDFADVPTAGLIEQEYNTRRGLTIDPLRATPSKEISAGKPAGKESTETTHYTVVDADGNIVSNTYTINDLYGSAVTIKGTGILMNDEMDDFSARPGKPNMFGLIQGERNAVKGGKRPLSSMTPTIVLRQDGTPWFAVGARGGPRIITAVLQTVMNVIDHKMDIQAAIDAPRIHHQWMPDELIYEPMGMSPDTRMALEKLGHTFSKRPTFIASATGIMIDEKGVRLGAVDSRADGAAIGY